MKPMRKIEILLFCILLVASLPAASLAAPSFMSTVADGTGNTVALLYTTAGGIVTRIDLYYDQGVSDYGSVSTAGSIAWALSSSGGNLAPGGKLHLSDGTFLVATPLVDSNPMSWEGESRATTIIQANGIGPNPTINVAASNVFFAHLTVNGNGQGEAASNGSTLQVNNCGPTALSGFTANDILVENGIGNGLGIFSVSNVLVTNSSFIGNGHDQLLIDSNSGQPFNNVQIIGNVTDDTGGGSSCFVSLFVADDWGVAESNVVVTNNIIRYRGLGSNETDGFVYDGSTSVAAKQVTVSGNTIVMTNAGGSSTAGSGVEICAVSDLSFNGNTVNNSYQGLDFCGYVSGVVSNNVVDTSTHYGILVGTSGSDLQISTNQVLNSTAAGIQISGGLVTNLDQNYIYGPSAGIILAGGLSGASGRIANNTITNTATGEDLVGITTSINPNWNIIGNTVTVTNGAAIVAGGSFTDIKNNQIFLGTAGGAGIQLYCVISGGCSDNTVIGNSIYGTSNSSAFGIATVNQYTENNLTISDNHMTGIGYGILTYALSTNSLISNNTAGTLAGGAKYNSIPATGIILIDTQSPVTYANLLSPVPAAGSQMMCSNCTQSLGACASGGSGALAVSNGSSWLCP